MVAADPADEMVTNLIRTRLQELKRITGLPIVFGGPTHVGEDGERLLVIDHLSGTTSEALRRLHVPAGRGLGGATLLLERPKMSRSYRDDPSISHDFDIQVVERERISSVFAFPVRVRGEVEGVFYGAVRDRSCLGDDAVRAANSTAFALEKELSRLLGDGAAASPRPAAAADLTPSVGLAVAELSEIIASTSDDELRARLERIRATLGGGGLSPTSISPLTSRELDALRLVGVGSTNAEIAKELGLTPQTVKAYLRAVMRKLEVHNRTAAVHVARRAGLL